MSDTNSQIPGGSVPDGAGQPSQHPAPGAPSQPFQTPPQHDASAPQYGAPGQPQYGAPGGQQYGAPGQPQYGAPASMSPAEEKQWGMFAHLGALLWLVSLGWLGPLIVFLVYKDRSAFVKQEAKEALNFQILMTIILVGGVIIGSILAIVGIGFVIIGLAYIAPLLGLIFGIIGAVQVNNGGSYRYPFNWRIIT